MGDFENDDVPNQSLPNLGRVDEFDLQLDGVRVSFAEGQNGRFDDFASKLPPFSHGVSFLLGRNGTGKSQFLSALAALSEGKTNDFVRASMVLHLPDEQQQLDYKHFVAKLGVSEEWRHTRSQIEYDDVAYNYWDDLVRLKTSSLSPEIGPSGRVLAETFRDERRLAEILESLTLRKAEIDGLVARMSAERQPVEQSWYFEDPRLAIDEIPPIPNTWSDGFVEFLAQSLCLSEWQFPRQPLSSDEFLIALKEGLRELYEQGRVVVTGSGMFLEKVPDLGGPLERLALLFWEDLRINRRQRIPGEDKLPSDLPVYFVGHEDADSTPPDGAAVRSWSWALDRASSSEHERPHLLTKLVSARLVKPFATTEDIQSLLVDQMDLHVEFGRQECEEDDQISEVSGVENASLTGLTETSEKLRYVVKVLRDLDIGLHDLRMYLHELGAGHGVDFPKRLRTQKFKGPQLVVEFRTHPSSRWSHIEHLSVGQRDVVYIVLNLLLVSTNESVLLNLLLFDEFGSHLHPSTTTKLLSFIHEYGRKHSISCIVASHDVAGLGERSTRECPRIFAFRNALGRLELTMNPPSDVIALAETLGTDILRAQSLVRLHVVVEGEMDRLIVEWLLSHPRIHPLDVEVVPLGGVTRLDLWWQFRVRYLSSPVLIVYDNRAFDFEQTWYRNIKKNPLPYERCESLQAIERSLMVRGQKAQNWKKPKGHDELRALISLAKVVLSESNDVTIRTAVDRLEFCGLDVGDILETLPIEAFKAPRASGPPYIPAHIATWGESHAKTRGKGVSEFDAFKAGQPRARIPEILRTLDASDEASVHPSLRRVRATILGILEARS